MVVVHLETSRDSMPGVSSLQNSTFGSSDTDGAAQLILRWPDLVSGDDEFLRSKERMTLNGQMMQQPLLISWLIDHAERHHGGVEVVSRRVEGDLHRETFRELAARARRLAKALGTLGVEEGDRVATLAWNGYRHMELYYAVSGSGAVLHTMNPRLHADQLVYMVRHAGDKVLFFDLTFLPLVESVAPCLTGIKWFVAMTDRTHMPGGTS
jgi:3-(methylthio)propionyl---CoA ligase